MGSLLIFADSKQLLCHRCPSAEALRFITREERFMTHGTPSIWTESNRWTWAQMRGLWTNFPRHAAVSSIDAK
jgi:hypothetical protein